MQSNSDQLSLKVRVFKIALYFSVPSRIIFGAPGRATAARPDLPKKQKKNSITTTGYEAQNSGTLAPKPQAAHTSCVLSHLFLK